MALHPTPETPPHRSPSAGSHHAHIPGWGSDLDPGNRPAYPKERTPPRLEGLHWDRPEDQNARSRIFHSTERPGLTPVFGSSAPPSGLSGRIRAWAYRLSENDVRHWLLLLFADRINAVEGIAQDLGRGRFPNILSEMGIKAEWRHNRLGLLKKTLVVSMLAVGAYRLVRSRRSRGYRENANIHRSADAFYRRSRVAQRKRTRQAALAPGDAQRGALVLTILAGGALYFFTHRTRR